MQLDESAWKGTYQNVLIWPGTTDETKAIVTELLQQFEASPTELAEIEQTLAQMPTHGLSVVFAVSRPAL